MLEFLQYVGHHQLQVLDAVAHSLNDQNTNRQGSQVLLLRQVAVHREQHVELRRGQDKEHQGHACLLKNGDGQFPAHGRKVIEEHVDGVPRPKMIEERPDWHPRSNEDGRSAVDLGVNGDELRRHNLTSNATASVCCAICPGALLVGHATRPRRATHLIITFKNNQLGDVS